MAKRRLSYEGQRILHRLETKYKFDSKGGLNYLMKIDGSELRPYDRQQIGRVAVRLYSGSRGNADFLTTDDSKALKRIYENFGLQARSPKYEKESDKMPMTENGAVGNFIKKVHGGKAWGLSTITMLYKHGDKLEAKRMALKLGQEYEKEGDERAANADGRAGTFYDLAREAYKTGHVAGRVHTVEKKIKASKRKLEEEVEGRMRIGHTSSLDTVAAAVAVGGFISALFFLSPNMTGNVIGNMAVPSSNLTGIVLFFVGLAGLFFTLKKR